MRSLLLASAAVLITAGIACAQTASPMPPATGSTGEPMATSPTAGKTAPAYVNGPASSASDTPMATSNTGSSTVPNSKTSTGSTGTMATKSDTTQAPSSGMGSMGSGSSGMSSMNTGMTQTHHVWSGTMPQDADAHTYLKIASMAIKNHDKATADEALSRAETRMLTRSVPASGSMMDDSAGVKAVENARQAVDAGNYHEAMMDTDMAMHHHMMGGSGMGGGMTNSFSMGDQSSGSVMPGQGSSSPGMSAGASSGSQQ